MDDDELEEPRRSRTGQPIVTIDETPVVAVVATRPIDTPAGLTAADADEARSLTGSF